MLFDREVPVNDTFLPVAESDEEMRDIGRNSSEDRYGARKGLNPFDSEVEDELYQPS